MKLPGYYSSGEFARMANVSIRTIRFYDQQNILKPSYIRPSGARFYTDSDFARLQQILLLKYLGFSLDNIRDMTINDMDSHFMLNSLRMQKKLVQDRIEQMQLMEQAIDRTVTALEKDHSIDWSRMLELIHLTGVKTSLKTQYQNAVNISARIALHKTYSTNKQGWFPWIYDKCSLKPGMKVLELGCGNGALWTENKKKLPEDISILLSDISEGMISDARRNIGPDDLRFSYRILDAHRLFLAPGCFDRIIANHVLFYCEDIPLVCSQAVRLLKPSGVFVCSTYGRSHMKEISALVAEFDKRIVLSNRRLYEQFGLENGEKVLRTYFGDVHCIRYEDSIEIDRAEPLIDYILSCHGNQNQYLLERYKDFRAFVEEKIKGGFHITKDAGLFICKK
ncbi:MAG: MerR family transcriptional regulator [Catenibacillus sp.]